jgi:hypothetical protein
VAYQKLQSKICTSLKTHQAFSKAPANQQSLCVTLRELQVIQTYISRHSSSTIYCHQNGISVSRTTSISLNKPNQRVQSLFSSQITAMLQHLVASLS